VEPRQKSTREAAAALSQPWYLRIPLVQSNDNVVYEIIAVSVMVVRRAQSTLFLVHRIILAIF